MDKKIAFFTEGGLCGKFPRNYTNARVDVAWQIALDAEHIPLHNNYCDAFADNQFDVGIVIIPKKDPVLNFDRYRRICKKIGVMQEGPHWFWQDWPVSTQFEYLNLLETLDFIFVHNEIDRRYYRGIGYKSVYVMPTVMIEDTIRNITEPENRAGIMIGGNFTSWYSGVDSYMVSSVLENEQVYCPSMGRKQSGEDDIAGINYLNYVNWSEWMSELSKRKYAIHLMRTHAAGTFALNCAKLAIPCIGYKGLDTQENCFPELSVPVGDLEMAKVLLKKLHNDKVYYSECAIRATTIYKNWYSENVFTVKMNSKLTEICGY